MAAAVAGCVSVSAGCREGTSQSSGTSSRTPGGLPDEAPINVAELFPAGRGRDLALQNCQSCHTVVPILVLQMDAQQWTRNSLDHRERLPALSDEDFAFLYDYLRANFNPDRPVPELPKALLETWTGY